MSFKILIADDDFDNRSILRDALEAREFLVVQAANGLEAVELAVAEKPDLILMDLSMPKLNGWKATERIRQIPEIAKTPIFAFTAHAMEGDDAKALGSGCDEYISKPCVPREVVRKVDERLRAAGGK